MRIFIILFWASSAFSSPLSPLMDQWADDFTFDHESFSGDWSSQHEWEGRLCNGKAGYRGQIGGAIDKVKFKLIDGYIEATADLKDVWGHLEGSYKSGYSACATLSGWVGLTSDSAHLVIRIYLNNTPEGPAVKQIQIVETLLGRLHFGVWLPNYLENYASVLANRALAKVWASQLGSWVNHKLTENAQKRRGGQLFKLE